MSVGNLKVTLHAEVLCKYDGNIVLALFLNDKFSSVMTVNEEAGAM
ncbi:hypothetical protein [Salibacterium sp. K-3]